MEHPFLPAVSLDSLSLEDLQAKISELNGKLTWAGRARNMQLQRQLIMILESYGTAYSRKLDEQLKKQNIGNVINIRNTNGL